MIRIGARILALVFLVFVAPGVARAAESYDNCTGFITSLPAVISTQGTWCMKQDLTTGMTSGNAIIIATNNVTVDCNNFKLGGLAAGIGTQTRGVYALDRQNTTVRNCNVRGFWAGIFLESAFTGGNVVEDNRLDGNTFDAIRVDGDGSTVRRNGVFDTGGSTLAPGAYGIATHYNVDIIDNTVSGVAARIGGNGTALGIQTYLTSASSVNGNRVRDVMGDGSGSTFAIYNFTASRLALRDNDLLGSGGANSIGLVCQDASGSAKGNVISGFINAISGCSDDGGNAVHP